MTTNETPFVDLPAALVEEVIKQTAEVSEILLETFRKVRTDQQSFRNNLLQKDLIRNESSLGYPPLPTTCAADGSYGIERLLTADLVAAAAVAVEGLTPPSEKRHWEQPRHITYVRSETHHPDTATIVRAVMIGSELILSNKAPHDLIMVDGSLTIPIIYFNQAMNKVSETLGLQCSRDFVEKVCEYLEAYASILRSERSDRNFVGLPKYSTRREIGKELGWPLQYDDRGMLTFLLNPGEFTKPIFMEQPEQRWHLYTNHLPSEVQTRANDLAENIIPNLEQVSILYYKPHDWIPALRIEIPKGAATNKHRLAVIIQGVKHQCATPSMLEPYPLYLADRTVKALSRAIPTFRQITTQRISEKYAGNIGEIFLAMHGYRSESGR
ncbi:MAG TPA: DNA double-strand break repair nuclease NurA [Syntrophales bacterium]|nr:DNA double-strand break repair nuclease NurA [Syntrophales bacterium]